MSAALICDTSAVLAASDAGDINHRSCLSAIRAHRGPLILSPFILAELDYLVRDRLGGDAARRLADDVASGAYDLASLTADDVAQCVAVDRSYADLGLGLADASLLVLAKRLQTLAILTLDERHLRAVRPLQGGVLQLLPADA